MFPENAPRPIPTTSRTAPRVRPIAGTREAEMRGPPTQQRLRLNDRHAMRSVCGRRSEAEAGPCSTVPMAGYFGISFFKKDPPRVSETGQTRNTTSLLQASERSINLFAGLVFSIAVALLQTTLQLVALAVDRGEIIVSEFAPFLQQRAVKSK